MSVYAGRPHTDAVLAALRAALEPDDQVGDGGAYDDDGAALTGRYAVLYPLGSATYDGSLTDPQRDAQPVYQVTYVGVSREQAEWLRDKGRAALVGQAVTVAGRTVSRLRLDLERPVQRDDDVQPAVFTAIDQYRLTTT